MCLTCLDSAPRLWIVSPVATEPVNAMRLTAGCVTSASLGSAPPVTMFMTPGGKAAANSSASPKVESEVCGAGFITTQLPVISAGSGRVAANITGWLKAVIRPTTP